MITEQNIGFLCCVLQLDYTTTIKITLNISYAAVTVTICTSTLVSDAFNQSKYLTEACLFKLNISV